LLTVNCIPLPFTEKYLDMATTIDLEKDIHELKQKLVTGTTNNQEVKEAIKKLEEKKSRVYIQEWLAQ